MKAKSLIVTILGVILPTVASFAQMQKVPAIPRNEKIEKKVERTLSHMSLDEKIGQMLDLQLDVLGTGEHPFQLCEERIETVIGQYKTGAILNAPGASVTTVAQWCEWIPKIQKASMKHMGIPTIYGLDNNHGSTYVQDGTLYPQPLNQAASFNTDMVTDLAKITAYETRAADVSWVFNPTVDLGRDPRWSRLWESFGEDAIVNSKMVVATLKGLQGDDPNHIGKYNVAPSVKALHGLWRTMVGQRPYSGISFSGNAARKIFRAFQKCDSRRSIVNYAKFRKH